LKELEELATEDAAEDLDGEEEWILGMNPAGVAWVETASGNDAVEMRMQTQHWRGDAGLLRLLQARLCGLQILQRSEFGCLLS
jgi:hypothetical protein